MKSRIIALAIALAATGAFGEAYKVNVHLSPMFGLQLQPQGMISGAEFKIDVNALSIGPVSPQLEAFGLGSGSANLLEKGSLFGGGLGLRWRILNDEKGYFFMPGGSGGNLHGNLYLDADFLISNGGGNGAPRVGFDVGLGYEISLIDGLQIGPFVKLYYLRDPLLLFGLSFSIGGPAGVPADFDPDNDGIKGPDDKCPTDAEDVDGFEDTDGCPDKDHDRDSPEGKKGQGSKNDQGDKKGKGEKKDEKDKAEEKREKDEKDEKDK